MPVFDSDRFPILAYVDLETTGTRPKGDRITEIAIIRVEHGEEVARWSSLVDPEVPIPEYIKSLTGIDDAMVRSAPAFGQLLDDVQDLFKDATLVAHNANFDAGFLRHAFERHGQPFDYPVLCTVKLSRRLYPSLKRHGLDALMVIHGLDEEGDRHRAMTDTALLPQLVQCCVNEHGVDQVEAAFAAQTQRTSLPSQLDESLLNEMPKSPGVYLFYGDKNSLLYVGKSVDIRSRVMSHFSDAKRNDKEQRLSQAVRDIQWQSTSGELSALLLESRMVKELSPIYNRRLRRHKSLFSWYWAFDDKAPKLLDLAKDEQHDFEYQYGLYRNPSAATKALRSTADEHELCKKVLGLEKGKGACFAYQLKKCKGACVGDEPIMQHNLRVAEVLLPMKLEGWPYDGPIAVEEHNVEQDLHHYLVFDQWRYMGEFDWETDRDAMLNAEPETLDLDTYKILRSYLKKHSHQIKNLWA